MTTPNTTLPATRGPQALARPDFIKEGARGKENIQDSDIKFPALKLAQSMTPEAKRSEPEYLEGLREGDLFNNVTREIYGDGPVRFLVVKYLGHRNTEFDPKDRKVVIEADIPDGDPRCQFTMEKDDTGKLVKRKPRATTFKDFLILLIHEGRPNERMTLSLKSTQLKKATALLSKLDSSKLDSFAHLIEGTPVSEHKGGNAWYGWRLEMVGYPSEAAYFEAEAIYKKIQEAEARGQKIVPIDTDAEAVGDTDGARDGEVTDDEIPF